MMRDRFDVIPSKARDLLFFAEKLQIPVAV